MELNRTPMDGYIGKRMSNIYVWDAQKIMHYDGLLLLVVVVCCETNYIHHNNT